MNANAFEFDVPTESKGSNSTHDNFVSDFMETHEKIAKQEGNKLANDSSQNGDKPSVNDSIVSDLKADELQANPETRMDGKKLYPDPKEMDIKKHLEGLHSSDFRGGDWDKEKFSKPQADSLEDKILKDYFKEKKKAPVSDKERDLAKEELEGQIPDIVNAEDRERLVAIQGSIIDGDMDGLAKVFKSIGKDAEDLPRYLKEVNRQLKELGSDTELLATKDGRVFVHGGSGDLAVQINQDGTSEVRAVDRTRSGAIVVNPGEVLNRSVDEVAGNIGDSTTREIQNGGQIWIHKMPGKLPDKLPGGKGGDGDKGNQYPDFDENGKDSKPDKVFPGPLNRFELPEAGKPGLIQEFDLHEAIPNLEALENKKEGRKIPKDSK